MKLKILKWDSVFKKVFLIILIFISGFLIFQKTLAINNDSEKFIITEIMYDPEGKNSDKSDWFEVLAKNDFIIDKNWRIIDEFNAIKNKNGRYEKCHTIKKEKNSINIKKGEYIVFVDNMEKFRREYSSYNGKIFDTVLSLQSKNPDSIKISIDNCYSFEEEVFYNKNIGGYNNGYTLELDNGVWRESYVKGGTPGKKNSKKPPPVVYSNEIYINEILPNPIGEEKTQEFIELYNNSSEEVKLEDWQLKDKSKTGKFVFSKDFIIKAKKYLVIYRDIFKFALNNSGEESVYLLNPNNEIVSQISYENAKENISYGFNWQNKKWRWSRFLTPNKNNKFDKKPKLEVKIDKKIYKNIYADFEIKINNIKKDKLKIVWSFGDGHKSYKQKTKHKYKEQGKYSGNVKIFTGSEDIVKKFKINVKKFPKPKVKIIALMPNPKGKDSDLEWIEIKNKSKKKINLKGWSIATGTSSKKITNHPIREDIIIKSGKTKKITRNDSKFSLGNKKCKIQLRYPNGKIAYKVKYKEKKSIKENSIYQKIKGEKWKWVKPVNYKADTKKQKNNTNIDKKVSKIENIKIAEKFIGKQSEIKREKIEPLELVMENIDVKIKSKIITNNQNVLGVWNVKIREENGFYYFTPPIIIQKHYAVKFWDNLIIKINSQLNNII